MSLREVAEVPEPNFITDDFADAIRTVVTNGNHLKPEVVYALLETRRQMKAVIKKVAKESTDPLLKYDAEQMIQRLENLA